MIEFFEWLKQDWNWAWVLGALLILGHVIEEIVSAWRSKP